ncbi:MAG: hypothetical protein WB683_08895, partial [Candidatus Sulfotelmatobacter sp.]
VLAGQAAQLRDWQLHLVMVGDYLCRTPIFDRKSCAQRLVTANDFCEASLEYFLVERTGSFKNQQLVIKWNASGKLPM